MIISFQHKGLRKFYETGISPDLAIQLERAGQSKARFWVTLQANYDLWQATKREHPDVIKLDIVA